MAIKRKAGKKVIQYTQKEQLAVGKLKGATKKEEDATAPTPHAENWLGDASGDEALALSEGSSEADGSDGEGEESEDKDNEEGPDDDVEPVDDGASKKNDLLARVAAGGAGADMTAVKQAIHDDVTLLSNWRKSKMLGHGRAREEVFNTLVGNCAIYFGYNEELAEYFLQMFNAEQALKFFEANEQQRPLTIRTNALKARRQSLIQSLTARKMSVDPVGSWTKVGLKVYESAVPVGATPEYLGGQYMIQSASSFVPVMALAPQQNETILDMAAAPGGKTTYIGQLMKNSGVLFANDLRKDRCKALVANVHRMGLTNVVVTTLDGKKMKGMLPKMDRILLDAPCSGSGIIARDPSVKVRRGVKEFEEHSRLQKELLVAAIDMVDANSKTGGYLVYSTCSVAVEENEAVVDHALKVRNVELVSFASAVDFGVEGFVKYRDRRFHPSVALTRRYLPHVHNMDGFFVAKFKKTSNDIPERHKKDRTRGDEHVKVWGEEHWTKDMMETVIDFDGDVPAAASVPTGAKAKKLNKIDRKKLKRQLQLQAREAAAATSANRSGAAGRAREPEEEPKPTQKAAAAAGARLASVKRRRVASEESRGVPAPVAKQDALAAPGASAVVSASGPKKKKRRAA